MTKRRVVLHFPPEKVDQAVIYRLAKDYDLIFNILQARVTPRKEGILILELTGNSQNFNQGLDFLKSVGVTVQPLSRDIARNEEKCTHCGACLAVCPTDALTMNPETKEIIFNNKECIACEACVAACPPRAMEVRF